MYYAQTIYTKYIHMIIYTKYIGYTKNYICLSTVYIFAECINIFNERVYFFVNESQRIVIKILSFEHTRC